MRKPGLLVLYYGLLLGLPSLLFGFPNPTHDGHIHEVWFSNFAAQFWAGDWYPRWLHRLNGGLGGPPFYFYPPAPYFITSLIQPLFPEAGHSWRILGVSAALALLLSGWFAFVWLKSMATPRAAGLGAVLYMAAPYHFAVDLHTRGAFGELWSFVWMPLVLYFARRVGQKQPWGLPGLAVSYALLILTHLPTTLIFSVLPPAWVLWRSPGRDWFVRLGRVAVGMALGVGLSCVYLLPALLGQDAVSMQVMRTGHSYYENGFFLPHPTWTSLRLARDAFEHGLFWMVLATAGVGVCAWFLTRAGQERQARREVLFWAIVGMASLAMMFPVSKPVYQLITQLQLIQFPWRFVAVLTLAVAALAAPAIDRIRAPHTNSTVLALVAGGALLFQWVVSAKQPLLNTSFSGNPHLSGPPSDWKENNWDTAEYRPRWARTDVRQIVAKLCPGGAELIKARVTSGQGTVLADKWKPGFITVLANGRTETVVEVSQLYYPGWSAILNERTPLPVEPSSPDGLLRVTLPAGTHLLELRMGKSHHEVIGERVSLGSLVFVCLGGMLSVVFFWKARKESGRPTQAEKASDAEHRT